MNRFISGMITMGYATAALFFLRFWWRTCDRLFVMFAVAFVCFALNQILAAFLDVAREEYSYVYLLRLAGFSLLIFGIVGKNLNKRSPERERL
jgi:hypothetical protein